MSAWLITGGAGFIGSNFIREIASAFATAPLVLDALTYAGNLANIADLLATGRAKFIRGDIRDQVVVNSVFEQYEIEHVVHFAAESHVDRSILGPRAFIETNVTGTLNLLMAAQARWRSDSSSHRFLHVSTDEVFGSLSSRERPFTENSPYSPNSPYAASKAAADHLVRAWHHTYGLPTLITNCSNNYGPWQFPEKLIPLAVLSAVSEQKIPVYGDGQQVRDWLHVKDHCAALMTVLKHGTPGETYCIGGDNERPNLTVVQALCDAVDRKLGRHHGFSHKLIRHVADRPGHDRRYAIDSAKIRQELGWKPKISMDSALDEVVDWYLENTAWIDDIRSGEYLRYYEEQYGHRLGGAR